MVELPLMINAPILPFIFEYEVEKLTYENSVKELNFFDYYTNLLLLRDKHCEEMVYEENYKKHHQDLMDRYIGDDFEGEEEEIEYGEEEDCDDEYEDDYDDEVEEENDECIDEN